MMRHGVTVYLIPITLGGEVGLFIEEEYLPFWRYNEKLYYNIEKPTIKDIEELGSFEINTPTPSDVSNKSDRHITAKSRVVLDIRIEEWRKIIRILP